MIAQFPQQDVRRLFAAQIANTAVRRNFLVSFNLAVVRS